MMLKNVDLKALSRLTFTLLVVVIGVMLFMPSLALAQSEPAGFVLMSSGDFAALQPNKVLRKLSRKSPFYSGEVLRTGADAKAQVRFRDGSLIALRADTEIKIDEFRFDEPNKGEDKNIFTLINGGFRTITGKIGKKNPENYQMKSSVASIGVRGTTYEVVLGKEMSVAAWQGTIVVANDAGKLELGVGAAYNFATIADNRDMPHGLLQPPTAIRSDTKQQKGALEKDNKDNSEDAKARQDGTSGEQQTVDTASTDEPLGVGLNSSSATIVTDAQTILSPDTTGSISSITSPPSSPLTTPTLVSDARLTGVTLNRVGMSVRGGVGFKGMLANGLASDGTAGAPVITDNGFDPSQVGFSTTPATVVLKQGAATLQVTSLQSLTIDANNTVTWGAWQGAATSPAQLETDAANASVFTAIGSPVYWATATPTANASVAARTGMVNYRNAMGYLGGGNSGAISNLYLDLDINFNTGATLGKVHIYTPTEFWNINLSGVISAPVLNFTSISGSVNGVAGVQGSFDSLFTGINGNAILSAFDFEATGNPALHVEGLVLANDTPVGDARFTATEAATFTQVGIAMVADPTFAGSRKFIGHASNGSTGSPVITDNGLLPGAPLYASTIPLDVLRKGGATLRAGSLYNDATRQVSWGIWDAAVTTESAVYTSVFDPLEKTLINKPIVWLTLTPTSNAVIAGYSGQARYRSLNKFVGQDQDGDALALAAMSVALDFSTGNFKGAGLIQDAGSFDNWRIDFNGTLNGARLQVGSLSGVYNGINGSAKPLTGSLDMYFTGTAGASITGAFDLEWIGDPSKYILGAFDAVQDVRLSNAEQTSLTRIGIAAFRNNAAGAQLSLGMASDGAGGSPILTQNGFLMNDTRFHTTPPNGVVRQGTAPNAAWFATYTDPTYGVSWGAWDAAAGTPATIQTDLTNAATITNQTAPVMWMTVLPTDPVTLAAKTGVARYTTTYGSMARTGLGYAASTSHYLSVDFGTGMFSGYALVNDVEMATAGTWAVTYNGLLHGPNLEATAVNGKYSGYWGANLAVTGGVSALFISPTADAVAGAFEFELASNPSASVQGVFISQQDLRLAPAIAASMNRIALSACPGCGPWVGQSTDLSGPTPVMSTTSGSLLPGQAGFLNAGFSDVLSKGAATNLAAPQTNTTYAGYPISWGAWNSGWVDQFNSRLPASQNTPAGPLYWMTLTPTDPAVIAAKVGSVTYATPVAILGGGTGGAINPASFAFSATVNFNTGAITAGTMTFSDTGPTIGNWSAQFNGTIKGSSLAITPTAINYGYGVAPTGAASGGINAVFTGPAAQMIGGSFNFGALSGALPLAPTAQNVSGVFLVQ